MEKQIIVNESTINEIFGKKLRIIRNERELSQEAFADLVDMHRTYIGQVERAEKNITIKNIAKIANALGIDIRELFNFDDLI